MKLDVYPATNLMEVTMERFWIEFNAILDEHGHVSATSSKRISIATFHARKKTLQLEFSRLRQGRLIQLVHGQVVSAVKYKLDSPRNLKPKHIQALIADWKARALLISVVHNRLSHLRVFARWIGKQGIVPAPEEILAGTGYEHRKQVAQRDVTWSGCGMEPRQKIGEIAVKHPRVAMVLELMLIFKLRLKEALLLRPWFANQESYLDINRGTKGGRSRTHKIVTEEERSLIDRASRLVENRNASMTPKDRSFSSWCNHVYYVMRKHGITRKQMGTSTHGLRHEGLNSEYKKITGADSPIKGGRPGEVSRELDRFARQQVAEAAGHSRPQVSSAYLGGFLRTWQEAGLAGSVSESVCEDDPAMATEDEGEQS